MVKINSLKKDNPKKVIYIFPSLSTFIKKDIEILEKHSRVIIPSHRWSQKWLIPLRYVQQLIFLLGNIKNCHAIFVMFGGHWSLLPSILGKVFKVNVYIILGGTDCVSFPEIKYGSLRKPLLARIIQLSYIYSNKLIPVDESLVFCKYDYFENRTYDYQGYNYFFPNVSTPHETIYNGFPPLQDYLNCSGKRIKNSFILIAYIPNLMRFKLKGADIIFELAKFYCECSFTIIGIEKSVMKDISNIPENIKVMPFLSQIEITKHLVSSEFILQLSISEGFPNSLAEGMQAGCIPIGSNVGAIPKIIDNTGFIMRTSNLEYIKLEFQKITALDQAEKDKLCIMAMQRIENEFPISKREKKFLQLID